MNNLRKNKNRGFGIIEVLVSMSIMALVIVTMVSLASATFLSWDNAKNKAIAQGILQDVIESIHNKRDTNVLGGISSDAWNKELGDASGLIIGGGAFTKTGSTFSRNTVIPSPGGKTFTTDVVISDLDGTPSDIPVGAATGSRKKVEVTVKWTERGALSRDIKGITYITDWRSKY